MFVVISQRLLESDLYHEDWQEHLNNFCYFVSEIDWVSVGFSKDFKPRRGKLFNIIFSSLFSWKCCLWEWTGNLNFLSYQCGLGIDWHNGHLELQIKFLEIEEEWLYYERILFSCFVVVFCGILSIGKTETLCFKFLLHYLCNYLFRFSVSPCYFHYDTSHLFNNFVLFCFVSLDLFSIF